ncbi:MAG: hypothetical protein OXT65_02995 [Alphaproteobacteria bacterium]|nr:hypothetical protein [Alphaproteobacteria bacterium]
MFNKYDCYPYKLFQLERCMGMAAQQRFAEGQLRRATENFMQRVKNFHAATGHAHALTVAQKEEMLPYLKMLAESGWPLAYGRSIIESRDYDTKSLNGAETAFKSIGAFAAEKGLAEESGLHIAMHYIGRTLDEAVKGGFNPAHPRPPARPSSGGLWRGGSVNGAPRGQGKPGADEKPVAREPYRITVGRPADKPVSYNHPPLTPEQVAKINQRAPAGIPPEDLLPNPAFGGLPTWYVEGAINNDGDEMVAVISGAAGAIGSGARAAHNAIRLRRYLNTARQIPKGVRKVGSGAESLSSGQRASLKTFTKKHSKYKGSMGVTNYSDGRAIYTVKHPAKNIPGSYTIWDKQVDAAGRVIRTTKTTVGPDGELIHIKNY